MIDNLLKYLADGGVLVVPQRLLGTRLGLAYARQQAASGQRSFRSPDLLTVDAWLRRIWQDQAERLPTQLITRSQSQCLWEQIVIARGTPGGLMATAQVARWAAAAWRDLQRFHIDPSAVAGPADTRTFLGWVREYQAQLRQNGWVDPDQALIGITAERSIAPAIGSILWLPGVTPTPAEVAVPRALAERGWPIRTAAVQSREASVTRAMLADESSELSAAIDWARGRLEAGDSDIALVVPDLAARRAEVRAAIGHGLNHGDTRDDFRFADGEPAMELPALGAALTALSLGSGSTDFGTLSRFLRSPFFAACTADGSGAARLETQLRRAPAHQWNLFEALGESRFRQQLGQDSPQLKACLLRAVEVLGEDPGQRSVSQWTELWPRYLEALGWPAGLAADAHADAIRIWQELLAELAALSTVLGPLSQGAALRQLSQVAGRLRQPARPGTNRVEIVGSMLDLGPTHDAVWVTGLDRDQWPPRPQPNPFLPILLQRNSCMPQADAARARIAAEAAWHNARSVTRVLVASWAASRRDEATQPSWMLSGLAPRAEPVSQPSRRAPQRLVSIPDPAPPLPVPRIPGGTRGLAVQSSCPMRAFLEMRLGARELELPNRGIAPWRRGLLAHRALELVYGGLKSSEVLAARQDLGKQVDAAVRRAAAEQLGNVRGLQRRILDLERTRLSARIEALLALERQRPAFSVEGLELRQRVTLEGLVVEARLDRLDRDEHGNLIVIDYKTGESRVSTWLTERPLDVQVPLYMLAVGDAAAALIVDLKADPPRYKGLWDPAVELPARSRLGGQSMAEIIEGWRAQITQLVREMAAGDARLLPDRAAAAQGVYAPATRIFERLAE